MKKNTIALMMLFSICIILTAGCVDNQNSSDGVGNMSGDMIVAVTVLPQAEFVEKIAGDNVEVIVMVPPGADLHSYEPSPGQLRDLSNAKLYAMMGSGISIEDSMIAKIADLNPDMLIIDCSQGIIMSEMEAHEGEDEHAVTDGHEGETSMDPHIWTSPANVKLMVETIYEGLVELDPENETTYLENKNAYLAELDALDEQIKATLSGKEGSSFMVYHPAWGYFAKQYGLIQVSVEIEGKEPSVRDMQNIIDEANEKNIKVIFVQTGFSTVSASAIANEIGGEVVEVDPLAKDYIENLAKVAEAFEKGLA
ncbi:MAG: zinc ABC transporter substrate-binding protein [Methanolobus sp.]|nr:zinc ABC transporter substrate-binding protein [Methanolobus sp.]